MVGAPRANAESAKSSVSYLDAILSGPGPETPGRALLLAAKGFLMGAADIIPGVSGGTIAFITGISESLIRAIKSVNLRFAGHLFKLDLKAALAEVHFRFLLPLLAGLLLAVAGISRVMHHLLLHHPVEIWSLFFGLIAASIWVVGRKVEKWNAAAVAALAAGAAVSYLIVGLIPVTTPEEHWFIFLCGMIAICAMILPGISGAFLLLLLGKYEYVTATLKNPFEPGSVLVILVFLAGCAVGIAGFSRVLSWLLTHRHGVTVAVLTGFMIGGMRKVWPWKEVLKTRIIRGKEYVLLEKNVLPDATMSELYVPLLIMAAGAIAVLLLELLSARLGTED
jgi:putative membrane protein